MGLLDVDINGPDIPKMLDIEDERLTTNKNGIIPIILPPHLKVMSMAFLLKDRDTPVIWRGPLKIKALRQFLTDFTWGDLEVLIFDMPPGTGDEAISIMQMIPDMDGVVVVTTPQEVSLLDTGKSLIMSRKMDRPVIGVVENMSAFVCPKCGSKHSLFGEGGGQQMAKEFGTELLGQIPLDPQIRVDEDIGLAQAFDYFKPLAEKILEKIDAVKK